MDRKKNEIVWEDLSIRQFKELVAAGQITDEFEQRVEIVRVLYGMTQDEVNSLDIAAFNELSANCLRLFESRPVPRLNNSYKIDGTTYNLCCNPKKLTTAQYIDYCNTMKSDPENFQQIMSIILVPEGKEYNSGYDASEVAALFEDKFRYVDVMGTAAFFLSLYKAYTKTLLSSSIRKLKKEMKKETDPEKRNMIADSIRQTEHFLNSGITS